LFDTSETHFIAIDAPVDGAVLTVIPFSAGAIGEGHRASASEVLKTFAILTKSCGMAVASSERDVTWTVFVNIECVWVDVLIAEQSSWPVIIIQFNRIAEDKLNDCPCNPIRV